MEGQRAGQVRKPGLSTMWSDDDPVWNEHLDVMRGRPSLPVWLARFWRESRGRHAVILRGTVTLRDGYRDLLGAVLLRRLRRQSPLVVVSDATITPYSAALASKLAGRLGPLGPVAARLLPLLARLLIRAGDGPNVRWCVLSAAERGTFSATWGVPLDRVVFTPFRHTLWEADVARTPLPEIRDDEQRRRPTRFFAGGNSLRDYPLLLSSVIMHEMHTLTIATSTVAPGQDEHLIIESLSETEYSQALRDCDVLVVPLAASTRSAGQQTYLNGMALGKIVVVADPLGAAHDYLDDGTTGVVVPAEVPALRAALDDVTRPDRRAHYLAMRRRARDAALHEYSPDRYRQRLLDLAHLTSHRTPRDRVAP